MHRLAKSAVIGLALAFAFAPDGGRPADAASQTIRGNRLLLQDPTGLAGNRKLLGLAREGPGSPATLVGDPTAAGASLRVVVNGGLDADQTFDLPAGGWNALGTAGFRYSNATTGGAVRKVLITRTSAGLFLLRVLIRGSDGPDFVRPPNLGTEGGFELTLNGGDSYCALYGGAAGGSIRGNSERQFKVVNPTASGCPTSELCRPTGAVAKEIVIPSDLIDGPLSRGRLGDFLLANDQIQVVIQKPGRVMFGIGTYGGNIIDADRQRCDVGERDNFEEMTPLINIENTANSTNVMVLNDGSNESAAIVRATGPDDLLDFVNASSVVAGFGFTFPAAADDRDLPISVQTDYILEPGSRAVQIETTITNTGAAPVDTFLGDYINGSGQVELFQPGYGFGEPLITTGCPAKTYKGCRFGSCDLCDFIAYSGEDLAAGVSYGYIHAVNDTTAFTTSGVTVPLLGQEVLFALIGGAQPNFHLNPAGSPGDALTVTRYFAVGDGSVASIEDIRNDILGIHTGTLTGTVTSGGSPVANADVAVIAAGADGPGTSTNVFDHFRTAADGTYRGTLPGGTYTVRANKDGRLFGTPDPANVAVASKGTTTQDFVLPGPGSVRVTVTDESGLPIPAKVQLVGFDGSPDPLSTQTILGLIHNTTGVFGEQREDGLSYGIAFVTFADRTGDTGVVEVEPGTYQLVVSHGPRYSAFFQNVTISEGATSTVAAQVGHVVPTPGFIAADFHVHSIQSPDSEVTLAERVTTMLADGMDFFTPSDHDIRVDYGPTLTAMGVTDLISTAPSAEITTFDYGHFNAWPMTIDPGQVNGGGIDWGRAGVPPGMDFPSLGSYGLSPAEIYAAVHAIPGALIQINHIRSHFNTDGLDIDTAEGGTGPPQSHTPPAQRRLDPSLTNLFDDEFDALEVWIGTDGRTGDLQHFVGENLGDWFNLLNQGILPSGTADSDTHQRRTTELNARNYVASTVTDPGLLGGQATTLAANIVAGRSIGTNALFVTVNANAPSTGQTAGLGIGQSTILSTSDGAVNVTVDVKSPLWAEFDKIQLFVNAAPQAYDHDNKPTTRNRYRALPSNVCSPASGCYEKVAGTDFTISTVNDFPSIPGAQHFEASATLNLTGLTGDAWVVVLVRGTDGVSHPLFPVMPNSLKQAGNTTFAQLTDGNLNEEGLLALAFTNPLFIDGNNDTTWTPPGVVLTP